MKPAKPATKTKQKTKQQLSKKDWLVIGVTTSLLYQSKKKKKEEVRIVTRNINKCQKKQHKTSKHTKTKSNCRHKKIKQKEHNICRSIECPNKKTKTKNKNRNITFACALNVPQKQKTKTKRLQKYDPRIIQRIKYHRNTNKSCSKCIKCL